MKLYTGPLSMFGRKVEIALAEKGVESERVLVPFSLAERYRPVHPEVQRINPKGQVPVLVDGDLELFDSTQIFEYLEDLVPSPGLWPQSAAGRALARRRELESDEVFFPHVITLIGHFGQEEGPEVQAAREAIQDHYAVVDRLLSGSEYLAGPYSYADIAFFCAQLFAAVLGSDLAEEHAAARAWRERMVERGAVGEVARSIGAYLEENHLPVPPFLG